MAKFVNRDQVVANLFIMKNVLVLCTGNSCRSQMAHGYLKTLGENKINVWSAGIETHGLNQEAVAAMKRDGIDISKHSSNLIEEYSEIEFDAVITVCDNAKERCPIFPGKKKKLHQNFEDPSKFKGSKIDRIAEFDRVRNQIKKYCTQFSQHEI